MITPFGASRCAIPAVKSLRSGTCANTLLPMIRSACRPSDIRRCASFSRRIRRASEYSSGVQLRRHWRLARCLSREYLMAGNAEADIHRCLRSRRLGSLDQDQAGLYHLAIPTRMLDPRRRIRGKICVFCENMLWLYVFLQLHQEAFVTYEHVQRKVGLHLVDLFGS